jgi:catalase
MNELIKVIGIIVFVLLALVAIAYLATLPSNKSEADIIDEIVKLQLEMQVNQDPKRRGQHPKAHGVVWADFIVEPNLPKDLAQGVFSKPEEFPAWIRFSNAVGDSDSQRGAMGMAIKLMNVPCTQIVEGEKKQNAQTQDFILLNSPAFFIKNISDYLVFFEIMSKKDLLRLLLFFLPRWRELKVFICLIIRKTTNPLGINYWSASPYKLGEVPAVKYAVRPSAKNKYIDPVDSKNPHHHKEFLKKQLKSYDVSFDFCIQRQIDPNKMPIEDPTIEWKEKDSPFVKVATIRILRQKFDSEEQIKFAENLSFHPWHSLPEHTPLGAINHTREKVYVATAKARREANSVDETAEPTPDTFKPTLL